MNATTSPGLLAHAPAAVAGHLWAAGTALAPAGPLHLDVDAATALAGRRLPVGDAADVASRLSSSEAVLAYVAADGRKTVLDAALANPHLTPEALGDLLRMGPGRQAKNVLSAYRRLSSAGTAESVAGLEDHLFFIPPAILADNLRAGMSLFDARRLHPDSDPLALPHTLTYDEVSLADAEVILEALPDQGVFPRVVGGADDPEWVHLWRRMAAQRSHRPFLVRDALPADWCQKSMASGADRVPLPGNPTGGETWTWSQVQPLNAADIRSDVTSEWMEGHFEATADVLGALATCRGRRPIFVEIPGTDAAEEAAAFLRNQDLSTLSRDSLDQALDMMACRTGGTPLPADLPDLIGALVYDRLVARRPGSNVRSRLGHFPGISEAVIDAQARFVRGADAASLRYAMERSPLAQHPDVNDALVEWVLTHDLTGDDRGIALDVLARLGKAGMTELRDYRDSGLIDMAIKAGPASVQFNGGAFRFQDLLIHDRDAVLETVLPAWFGQWPDLAADTAKLVADHAGALASCLERGVISGTAAQAVLTSYRQAPGTEELIAHIHLHLGDNAAAWELLDSLLAGGWDGGLDDAIGTAAELSGAAA